MIEIVNAVIHDPGFLNTLHCIKFIFCLQYFVHWLTFYMYILCDQECAPGVVILIIIIKRYFFYV